MRIPLLSLCVRLAPVVFLWILPALQAETVRVATYNIENYLLMDRVVEGGWRPGYPKPEASKSALRAVVAAVNPDILALQEIGPKPFLVELQRDLKAEGLNYPYAVLLEASDEERHLAVLSRVPFRDVRPRIELDFRYFGEREKVRRGLLEVEFETDGERWSLFVVHLKSKWTERPDDPEAVGKRTGEATAARNAILEAHDPEEGALYLIAGDFNDSPATAPLRRFLHRGEVQVSEPIPAFDSRGEAWTHHWTRQDLYSRVDYLLASPAMLEKVIDGRGFIFDGPGSGIASDHRLVWADFKIGAGAATRAGDRRADGERFADLLRSFRE